jgi:hypothetical protein
VVSVENGYGHHVGVLTGPQVQATTFYYMIASTFLITASAWSKTSFAITLLRITDSKTKKFVWFLIISMNLSKLVSAMLQWISCQPLQKSWNPLYEGGTCWDKMPVAHYNIFSGGKFLRVIAILIVRAPSHRDFNSPSSPVLVMRSRDIEERRQKAHPHV